MKITLQLLLCSSALLVGCDKRADRLDRSWSLPIKITESEDGLGGRVDLYKYRDGAIGFEPLSAGSARCIIMHPTSNSWSEVSLSNTSGKHSWVYPIIEETNDNIFFPDNCYAENDQLILNILRTRMSANNELKDEARTEWKTDKKTFFEETPPNIYLNEPGKRGSVIIGRGAINGSHIYVPCCVIGKAIVGNGVSMSDSLFTSGVLHSSDSGTTWQMEKISSFEGYSPSVCKTKVSYYYFVARLVPGEGYQLWYSRKLVESGSWDTPKVLTKTIANSYTHFLAIPENETVHVCWLDRRNEKTRSNPMYPGRQNWEVAYCQRRDSDPAWSKDVVLSKGLLYSYWPSMSVEGDKIVIAWSGIQAAQDGHSFNDPNDIYYVTSRNGGNTWSKPMRATDGAKDGVTSGEPQVVLLNENIHLFYTQGKMNLKQESPGLTKLNQPPWPIYYQQRPFPN